MQFRTLFAGLMFVVLVLGRGIAYADSFQVTVSDNKSENSDITMMAEWLAYPHLYSLKPLGPGAGVLGYEHDARTVMYSRTGDPTPKLERTGMVLWTMFRDYRITNAGELDAFRDRMYLGFAVDWLNSRSEYKGQSAVDWVAGYFNKEPAHIVACYHLWVANKRLAEMMLAQNTHLSSR